MKKIVMRVKKQTALLKTLFIFSVLIIVAGELLSISKTISFNQLEEIFQSIPVWKIVIMLIVGLAAVIPMFGYDITLNRMLQNKMKPSYLLETSWMINSINNIAGFGGIINIGLRTAFFRKKNSGKKVAQSLSKIVIFLLSGLSIWSFLSFLLVFFGKQNLYLQQYLIWLIIGSLYFPLVLLITSIKKDHYIGNISISARLQLILISFFEWTGVLSFFLLIGILMNASFHPLQVIPLYVAASIMGMSSMIPGGLGSFDVMIILGLPSLGIPRETVIVWLLLFRLFYYIVPFSIGIFLLIKNLGKNLNERFSGIPTELSREISHKLLVFLMYFSGIMVVLSATVPEAFNQIHWLSRLNPWSSHLFTQFPTLLLGFALVIMGRGIAAQVGRAYAPAIGLISITLAYSSVKNFNLGVLILLILLLIFVIFSKDELYRKQLVYSWEMITVDGIIFTVLTLLYIIIGVYNLPSFPHHKKHFISFFLFPSEKIWFSGLLAIILIALFTFLFIRYLKGEQRIMGEPLNIENAKNILNHFGGNANSQLVFLNDKNMYVYTDNAGISTVFLQFKTLNDKCIVMGDPSGKKEDFASAIAEFIQECDCWGYLPVFYEVSAPIVLTLHSFGYDFIKMGEEAYVSLGDFTLSGKKRRGDRAIMNRFEKEKYTFEILSPPYLPEVMHELRLISNEWLGNRKEKGFSLGFFSEEYLQMSEIAIVKNQRNEILAFANIMPTYTKEEGTIDLMRYKKEAPPGVMDFLFISIFNYMKENGVSVFNMGMAPLANVGTSKKSFFQERIAFLVYEFGSIFYSFQGLKAYKDKFASEWSPRYTLYSRKSSLLYAMIALLIIDNAPVREKKSH
ncbi:bifunctional lysylphosphatidylglycerol flippase/synthetase MprF [Enterococcus sp. BWT-B8]|uniref:bifunctional lysylphosphatidylglycerol flippase/synthetase MprF n=1 Tax=Enterococcus sp. BWT-B8 TaxID=2885157 RepID=UPI001E526FDC|nr:bifunctional lysylphosphatidylglycerol flippase/synthetase MprF [Enterococcus sp. BWT-B8]MCB5950737.1 bifunctional lysylphosphatidylglycerol flippase/synthetase MprF [Enterococcus sp. BWT-B8]